MRYCESRSLSLLIYIKIERFCCPSLTDPSCCFIPFQNMVYCTSVSTNFYVFAKFLLEYLCLFELRVLGSWCSQVSYYTFGWMVIVLTLIVDYITTFVILEYGLFRIKSFQSLQYTILHWPCYIAWSPCSSSFGYCILLQLIIIITVLFIYSVPNNWIRW